MTSIPPTSSGGPLTPEQYAKLHFQGKTYDEASELMTGITQERDRHAQEAQAASEMIEEEIENGVPSGPDALRSLKATRDEELGNAAYYDEVVQYVLEHDTELGITVPGPEAGTVEGERTTGQKAWETAKATGSWVRQNKLKSALIVGGTALVANAVFGSDGATNTDINASQCEPNVPVATQIGVEQATQQPDATAAIAAAKQIVLDQAQDCTPEELKLRQDAAEAGVLAQLEVSGTETSTSTTPELDGTTTTQPGGATTTTEPAQTEEPEIDDTIFCGPDGEVIAVTVGPDGIVEDYSGDACEYPGPGEEVIRTEPGGGTDLVIGMER